MTSVSESTFHQKVKEGIFRPRLRSLNDSMIRRLSDSSVAGFPISQIQIHLLNIPPLSSESEEEDDVFVNPPQKGNGAL